MTYNTHQRSAAVSKSIGTNSSIIKTVILLYGDNHDSNIHAVVTRSRTLLATALWRLQAFQCNITFHQNAARFRQYKLLCLGDFPAAESPSKATNFKLSSLDFPSRTLDSEKNLLKPE